MKKHKILYINDWGEWGGAEKVTLNLIKLLNREQYEPHFILGSDGLLAQALRTEGVPVHIVPMMPMSVLASKKYMLYLLLPKFFWRLVMYSIQILFKPVPFRLNLLVLLWLNCYKSNYSGMFKICNLQAIVEDLFAFWLNDFLI
jgi:hypothetical protein